MAPRSRVTGDGKAPAAPRKPAAPRRKATTPAASEGPAASGAAGTETSDAKTSTTNEAAAKSGDRRKALEALRDTLARQLDQGPIGTAAQTAAQYRATLTDLASLEVPGRKRGTVDEIKQRREAKSRRAATNASANT